MQQPFIVSLAIFLAISSPFSAGGASMLLKVGDKAPDFTLENETGAMVHLHDYAGKNYVALIFYPGDETSGCTKQLCAVRDDYAAFEAKNVKVFGINPADTASHRKFIAHHGFQFPLLVDKKRKTAEAYGCSGTLFIKRTVYVIDPAGAIVYVQQGMPPDSEILNSVPNPAKSGE